MRIVAVGSVAVLTMVMVACGGSDSPDLPKIEFTEKAKAMDVVFADWTIDDALRAKINPKTDLREDRFRVTFYDANGVKLNRNYAFHPKLKAGETGMFRCVHHCGQSRIARAIIEREDE